MLSDLTLHFTGGPTDPFTETVQGAPMCEVCEDYVLKTHSTFCPLAPNDAVRVEGARIVDVVQLESLWTVEATFHLPVGTTFGAAHPEDHPAMRAVAKCEEEWRRAASVTRNTSFSFMVSSQSRVWLEDNVEAHPYVEHIELRRTPDLAPALAFWLATPHFG